MRNLAALTIFALAAASCMPPMAAAAENDPQTCAGITDSLRRLDCFDRMFPKTEAEHQADAAVPESVSPRTRWQITEERSPIDDSPTVHAYLPATETRYTGIGNGDAAITMGCTENSTRFVVATTMFMTADSPTVTTRINEDPAETRQWTRSANYKAVGLWNGSTAIPFLKKLPDNGRLVVRIVADNTLTSIFDLGHITPAVEKVRKAS